MERLHTHEQRAVRPSALSDDALLRELHILVASHRRTTAALVEHLGEVDARRLHVEKGFSSLFAYCVDELRFSEDEACRRIEAARLARRFPAVLQLLDTGMVSLTVLGLLKPHLTEENQNELLAGVSGASVRRAKEWLAARFPQPDVPSTIRKQPAPNSFRAAGVGAAEVDARVAELVPTDGVPTVPAIEAVGSAPTTPTRVTVGVGPVLAIPPSAPTRVPLGVEPRIAHARARVEPLSSDRFLVKFTANRAFRDKLELARDLMRHANPSGELSAVLERAVDMLVADLQKKKQGRTAHPRTKSRAEGERSQSELRAPQEAPRRTNGARVTRSVRREVVARDGWRCSFVSDDGRSCDARAFLEFDHEIPKGRGGGSRSDNLRLLCRAHNLREAERVYGRAHIAHAIFEARQARDGVTRGCRLRGPTSRD